MDKILEDMDASDKAAFYSVFYNEELYVVDEPVVTIADPELAETPEIEPGKIKNEPVPQHAEILLHNNKMADLLLLFNYPAAESIPEKDEDLISKALKAAGIDFKNDTCWLNTANYPELHWTDIETASEATKIIAFGIKPKLLPVLLTEGELAEENDKQILNVVSLTEMHDSKERKTYFWNGLKAMYNI